MAVVARIRPTAVAGTIVRLGNSSRPGTLAASRASPITLPEISAPTWQAWFEDFVNFNLGIFKLAPAKAEAAAEQIARLSAALYCERMELQVAKTA